MITLAIIAIIVAGAALAVAFSVRSIVRRFNNTLITIQREQVSMNNLIRGVELRVDEIEDEIGD